MRALAEIAVGLPTDKGSRHSYLEVYEKLLAPMRHRDVRLLEIGVCDGGSMAMWREWFTHAEIWGIDVKPRVTAIKGCHLVEGSATDARLLDGLFTEGSLDVIIDDGSHEVADQLKSWVILWDKLVKGGVYVVEDLLPASITCFGALGFTIEDRRRVKGVIDDVLAVRWK